MKKKKYKSNHIYLKIIYSIFIYNFRTKNIWKPHRSRGAAKRGFFRLENHWLRSLVWKKAQNERTENNEDVSVTFRVDWRQTDMGLCWKEIISS